MYELVLFAHLVGVALLFMCLSFSLGGYVRATRAATVQDVRSSLGFVSIADLAIGPAMLLLLASGLWMVGDGGWGWGSGWVVVAIGLFVLMGILGPLVEDRRIGAIRDRAAELADGPVPPQLEAMRRDPLLVHVVWFGSSQAVVFLYLMTTKPGFGGAIAAALVAGALSAVPARRMLRVPGAASAGAPAA